MSHASGPSNRDLDADYTSHTSTRAYSQLNEAAHHPALDRQAGRSGISRHKGGLSSLSQWSSPLKPITGDDGQLPNSDRSGFVPSTSSQTPEASLRRRLNTSPATHLKLPDRESGAKPRRRSSVFPRWIGNKVTFWAGLITAVVSIAVVYLLFAPSSHLQSIQSVIDDVPIISKSPVWNTVRRINNLVNQTPGDTPDTDQISTSFKRKPLHIRTKRTRRAALPCRIVLQSFSEHAIHNGLLITNLSSSFHPIHQLIRDGREQWDLKVERQSRTLMAAVEEYKRRNQGRAPPKGFDGWWKYVV